MTETRADTAPFDLEAGDQRGALLIHGFAGTPYEVRPLGEALAARGITAVGPMLPGHGRSPGGDVDALNATGWPDWVNAMEAELDRLRRRCKSVAVVGLSLGGLIACMLARRGRDLRALCSLSAPLWISAPRTVGLRALHWVTFGRLDRLPKAGADIRDPEARRRFPSASAFPLLALRSLMDFMPRVRAELEEIRVPALIMHGDHDHTSPPACAVELHRKIGTIDKRLVKLPRSFHMITVDVERELVAREVGDFIGQRTS